MEKIFEARTEREAIEKAVRVFGVNEEYIEVQVVSKKRGGFLGLSSKVVINATVVGLPKVDSESTSLQAKDRQEEEQAMHKTASSSSKTRSQMSYTEEQEPQVQLTKDQKREMAGIIETITSKMNIEVDVEFHEEEEQLFASLIIEEPSDQNLLIGKYGKNLDALQVIVNAIMQNKYVQRLENVVLEIENYRNKRTAWLTNLAHKKAEIVLKTKKAYTLGEMAPFDRKLVHSAIRNIEGVSTESKGNSYYKKIVIYNE